jgi:hypothetical protein
MEFPACGAVGRLGRGALKLPGCRRKTMIRVTKFASTMLPIAAVAGTALAIGLAAPAAAASRHSVHPAKMPVHRAAHSLYDVVPQGKAAVSSDDPSLTGGGSLGYNQNIYNW